MNHEQSTQLAVLLRARREALSLSASEVARRADVATGTVTRLELAQIPHPQIDNLRAIADVLSMPLTDLLTTAEWVRDDELPTVPVYLKLKYRQMPPEARSTIERYIQDIAARYDRSRHGPVGNEDEQ